MQEQERFNKAMIDLYEQIKAEGYNAIRFKMMIDEYGGLEAARILLGSDKIREGYTNLVLKDKTYLTVEHYVTYHPWCHHLFTRDQLQRAKDRSI